MSKEFIWNDKLVMEFVRELFDRNTFPLLPELDKFKSSHSTEDRIEWEVLELKCNNGAISIFNDENKRIYSHDRMSWVNAFLGSNIGWSIYKVIRLSDGETFAVADKIEFDGFGGLQSAAIHRFEVNYFEPTQISAYNGAYGLGCQRWKKTPQRTKLFTTEDGVDIFEGDNFWYVTPPLRVFNDLCDSMTGGKYVAHSRVGDKFFSTKEKAEEYVLMNKPLLSLNDIKWWIEKYFDYPGGISIEQLKELAKTKL